MRLEIALKSRFGKNAVNTVLYVCLQTVLCVLMGGRQPYPAFDMPRLRSTSVIGRFIRTNRIQLVTAGTVVGERRAKRPT